MSKYKFPYIQGKYGIIVKKHLVESRSIVESDMHYFTVSSTEKTDSTTSKNPNPLIKNFKKKKKTRTCELYNI